MGATCVSLKFWVPALDPFTGTNCIGHTLAAKAIHPLPEKIKVVGNVAISSVSIYREFWMLHLQCNISLASQNLMSNMVFMFPKSLRHALCLCRIHKTLDSLSSIASPAPAPVCVIKWMLTDDLLGWSPGVCQSYHLLCPRSLT